MAKGRYLLKEEGAVLRLLKYRALRQRYGYTEKGDRLDDDPFEGFHGRATQGQDPSAPS